MNLSVWCISFENDLLEGTFVSVGASSGFSHGASQESSH
jgi:hypothetical protein